MACRGVEVNLEMKRGKATLAKLAGPLEGKFKMIISWGRWSKLHPLVEITNLVRLDSPVETLLDTFIEQCAGHHVAVAPGDIYDDLRNCVGSRESTRLHSEPAT